MKGTLLDFSSRRQSGLIAGDDGQRYPLAGSEWRSDAAPEAGMRVDFAVRDGRARDVYREPAPATPWRGLYRSRDEGLLAGVCAGLAHKWQVRRGGLRLLTVVLSLVFSGLPVLIYLACWLLLPARATAGPR